MRGSSSYINDDNSLSILVAMGVKDKNEKHLGCVISSFSLAHLKQMIELSLQQSNAYYAVLNTVDDSIIVNSLGFNRETVAKELALFASGNENEQFYSDDKNSYFTSRIGKSPFVLIIGSNHVAIEYEDLLHSLVPYKFELLFATTILCCLIYLFYTSILEPFMTLSKAALSISNGDMDIEVDKINSKEGALVASALEKIKHFLKAERELINEVTKARNSLAITNLRLENKVVERTEELENAFLTKTKFMDNLNHEIMSPIQGISSISENLSTYWNEIDDKNKIEYINQIAYTTKRLLLMVSNLLDLSKFSNGIVNLNLSKIDLLALTKTVIDECKLLYMNQKSIRFHFSSNRPVYITADKDRITQLLYNLLVNAIKFSPSDGDVAINIIPTKMSIGGSYQDAIHFMLHDRGAGLDEEEIANIFSPFIQGKASNNWPGSVGLGLSICKEIVSTHHGKIWAASNKDGGASFNFIIPNTQPIKQEICSNIPRAIDLHHAIPNILMIDDEEVCLNSIELLLHGSKYNLIKAKSGQAGLKYLRQHHKSISLIMLDLMMPDMYGLNVLAEIKNDPKLFNIPIILQTGTSDEDEIVKAFDMGIFSFIRKPYQKQVILEEIGKCLKKIF